MSLLRTHTQQYARSECHTHIAKKSFDEIFDLIFGVDYIFITYMYICFAWFFVGRECLGNLDQLSPKYFHVKYHKNAGRSYLAMCM